MIITLAQWNAKNYIRNLIVHRNISTCKNGWGNKTSSGSLWDILLAVPPAPLLLWPGSASTTPLWLKLLLDSVGLVGMAKGTPPRLKSVPSGATDTVSAIAFRCFILLSFLSRQCRFLFRLRLLLCILMKNMDKLPIMINMPLRTYPPLPADSELTYSEIGWAQSKIYILLNNSQ